MEWQKLSSKKIRENWDMLQAVCRDIFGLEFDATTLRKALLSDQAQCWVLSRGKRSGVIITSVLRDDLRGRTNLLIYAGRFYGLALSDREILRTTYNQFVQIAKNFGCASISLFTENESLAKLADLFRGKRIYYLEKEV